MFAIVVVEHSYGPTIAGIIAFDCAVLPFGDFSRSPHLNIWELS
jgi:hypothetical protein